MCPARRSSRNRRLEPNLHTHPKGFRWKNPRTGKYHYLGIGVSEAEANEAARLLNLKFGRKSSIFDKIAAKESESFRSVVELHLRERLPSQRVSESTRSNRRYILQKIAVSELAGCDVSTISTRDVVAYLGSLKSESQRQQYRIQLSAVFKTAIQQGFIEHNPVVHTDAPKVERQRERLTAEGYAAIYELAEPWLRNLMDLMRLTLQRPDDLLTLKWSAFTGTHLRVEQGKTESRLAIVVRPELREVLERCRDNIASPYIVHRIPQRLKTKNQRSARKDHHTQILRPQASRAFMSIVRQCERFRDTENPPTLYECKSLGVGELLIAGWSKNQVQRLAGHRSVQMTEHYAKGHDAPFDEVGIGPQESDFVTEALL